MKETRIFAAPVKVRTATDAAATIAGYGALFDTPYEMYGYTESVSSGAFDKSLKERYGELAVLADHDPARVLGTTASDTARLSADAIGLYYEADLDLLDPDGVSVYRKVSTGKVRQSSFAFEVVKDEWTHPERNSTELPHRTLHEVRLWEASPVLWGANPATSVDIKRAARSLAAALEADLEQAEEAITEGRVAALFVGTTTEQPEPEPEIHSESTEQPVRIVYPSN
jgi:HK97 family phage prohead protease